MQYRIMMNSLSTILFFFILTISNVTSYGQQINWLSWEEALDKTQKEPKKIIVDIYTDWCTWCKKMDRTTFSDPTIVEYINHYYYAIKFDAQSKEPIVYQNKTYTFESGIWRGGYHSLAAEITNQKIKLPTIVFLDENAEILQALGGFRNTYEMELMAAYFNGNYHKSTPWKDFVTAYSENKANADKSQHDTSIQVSTRLVSQKRNK